MVLPVGIVAETRPLHTESRFRHFEWGPFNKAYAQPRSVISSGADIRRYIWDSDKRYLARRQKWDSSFGS